MKTPLWVPSRERVENANITRFLRYVNHRHELRLSTYRDLQRWSVDDIASFWGALWDFLEIRASSPYIRVVDGIDRFPGARWFPGARLNFAENLLKFRDDRPALVFRSETGHYRSTTFAELHDAVARLSASLRASGLKPGDRVAAYMPNLVETVVAMLATTAAGGVWASCSSEIGPETAVDRLGQIEPRFLFVADGSSYKGKTYDSRPNAATLARAMPSVEKVVLVPFLEESPSLDAIPRAVSYADFVGTGPVPALQFEQLPFDAPLFIMFSSGTTGRPKCIVQGAGGVLLNHLKELSLHSDLGPDDRILYLTTCSWMMWNWVVSALGLGARVLLYEGNPSYPDEGEIWRVLADERVTVFGTSATFLNHARNAGLRPGADFDLSALKEISQTGSPLSADGFEYVYREIKSDLHFNSISGGTEINGCFVAGSPIVPVYAGEIQSPALGMKVSAWDEEGRPVLDRQGELVCLAPSPSMPLYFWKDPNDDRYKAAYFDAYPGVWRHGDFVQFHSDTGGVTMFGRSDAVLKPSGVRIGTAEVYNVMARLDEIADCLVVGQDWDGDQRVILFVQMAAGLMLDDEVRDRIRRTLREKASPRHVPALIVETPDIPYTMNMKKVESAVSHILNGKPVTNRSALRNPESLDFYVKIWEAMLQEREAAPGRGGPAPTAPVAPGEVDNARRSA
jgi:acetoacetyl-CoA synthetase